MTSGGFGGAQLQVEEDSDGGVEIEPLAVLLRLDRGSVGMIQAIDMINRVDSSQSVRQRARCGYVSVRAVGIGQPGRSTRCPSGIVNTHGGSPPTAAPWNDASGFRLITTPPSWTQV